MPHSIRWRLLISYAAIALLTFLALGAVLLVTLRGYYVERETAYLQGNARAISLSIAKALVSEVPQPALEAQLKSFSFLAQVRVQVYKADGSLIADTGVPNERTSVNIASVRYQTGGASQGQSIQASGEQPIFMLEGTPLPDIVETNWIKEWERRVDVSRQAGSVSPAPEPGPKLLQNDESHRFIDRIFAAPGFFGFGLGNNAEFGGGRSDQSVTVGVLDARDEQLGKVILSAGPAYGRQIVEGVARGWAVAGGIAVLLAAGVGLIISRRISAPVVALTRITARMSSGDLSARAEVAGKDELGTLARSFNEMAGRVEDIVNTLRRFVADAAHELHTPLTALNTNLELAADEPKPERRTVYLQRAQGQLCRLQLLTDGLLDLSRFETTPSEHKPFDLAALVRESAEFYASQAEQAGLVFTLELPEEKLFVRGDAAQIRRVIGNLLDNAIKFTPEGGAVRLSCIRAARRIELRISDSGIGIPPDEMSSLFSRFHRARNAAAYPGSGLGLAIVKTLVERHGGRVCASQSGPGTCFLVRLPLLRHL